MKYVLPELDMQVSAEVVLKHFLVRIGMFPRTFCHNWQALMAWDPILALQDLLFALEWCEAATLILADTQYLNPILGAPAKDPLLTAQDPLLTAQDPLLAAQDPLLTASDPLLTA